MWAANCSHFYTPRKHGGAMAMVYPYRFTHEPSGFTTILNLAEPGTMSRARMGHTPLQIGLREIVYDAVGKESSIDERDRIYALYPEFVWKDLKITDLDPYDDSSS